MPNTYKDRVIVKVKSHNYYERKDQVTEAVNSLKPLNGSKIIFFKNGVCQGDAFVNIYRGGYYPTVSIHKSATVSVNFGPKFKYPPKDIMYRGVSIDTNRTRISGKSFGLKFIPINSQICIRSSELI